MLLNNVFYLVVLIILMVVMILLGKLTKFSKIQILSIFNGLIEVVIPLYYLFMLILRLLNKKMIGLPVLMQVDIILHQNILLLKLI